MLQRLVRARRSRRPPASRPANRRPPNSFASERLEPRTLLSAATGPNIVTPYLHDVEWEKVGLVADFTADDRPVSGRIDWGNGVSEELMLDYDAASDSGRVYGYHEYAAPGVYSVTFTLTGADGWVSSQSFDVNAVFQSSTPISEGYWSSPAAAPPGTVVGEQGMFAGGEVQSMTATPPTVQAVFVDSTVWTSAFRTYLGGTGYPVPAGSAQLKSLPWNNVNRVKVRFSEDVVVGQHDMLLAGTGMPSYAIGGFGYDPATFTATWTLSASIPADKLLLQVRDNVRSVASGEALDGEWVDGADAYNSGNGVAGGAFEFTMNVLPGDVNQDGTVTTADTSQTRDRQNTSTTNAGTPPNTYSPTHDINGTGGINALDTAAVRGLEGTEPAPGDTTGPSAPGTPINRPPVADSKYVPDYLGQTTGLLYDSSDNLIGRMSASDPDTPSTQLTYSVVTFPKHGTLQLTGGGDYLYTPDLKYDGIDRFTYKASDGVNESLPATVVFETTRQPVAANSDYYLFGDGDGDGDMETSPEPEYFSDKIAYSVLDNDMGRRALVSGYDGRSASVASGTTSGGGSIAVSSSGHFNYRPADGFEGRDTFTYSFTAAGRTSNQATVVIDVGPTPPTLPPPVGNNHIGLGYGTSSGPVYWETPHYKVKDDGSVRFLFDTQGDPDLAVYGAGGSAKGASVSVVGDPKHGLFRYAPPANFAGWDTFQATLSDNTGSAPAQTAHVAVTNDLPRAQPATLTTWQDTPLTDTLTATDDHLSPTELNYRVAVWPRNGILDVQANGVFTYTPKAGYVGPDRFSFLANDHIADGGLATVTIDVGTAQATTVSVSATDPLATEGAVPADNGQFTLTRTGSLSSALTVQYIIDPASTAAASDYTGMGTAGFNAGSDTTTLDVFAANDTTREWTETVVLRLVPTTTYAIAGPRTATVEIVDNDPVDLVLDGLGEAVEMTPGAFAAADPNREGPLVPLELRVPSGFKSGRPIALSATGAAAEVFTTSDGTGTPVIGAGAASATWGTSESIPMLFARMLEPGIATFTLSFTDSGTSNPSNSQDQAKLTGVAVDLDVDSDNNNGFDPAFPRSFVDNAEDAIEDDETKPGKIIVVNDNDDDGDGIPDFADGFNRYPEIPADDATAGERFIPVVLEIAAELEPSTFAFRLSYDASDPALVDLGVETGTYTAGPGSVRLWTRDGAVPRTATRFDGIAAGAHDAGLGYYVAASTAGGSYAAGDWNKLVAAAGGSPGSRTVTLWAEAVRTSLDLASLRLEFSLDPDGDANGSDFIAIDAARLTAYGPLVLVDGNRDGSIAFDPQATAAADRTTAAHPFRFWINDDSDRAVTNPDDDDAPDQVDNTTALFRS